MSGRKTAGAVVEASSSVSLRRIAADTLEPILALSVRPEQEPFVAPNVRSIAQAHFDPGAWFRAIYADETPVGFVLLHDETLLERPVRPDAVFLWRLMIDARYQGMGFGRRAMTLVVGHVRTRPGVKVLLTSHLEGESSAAGFYDKLGFERTGLQEGGETERRLLVG